MRWTPPVPPASRNPESANRDHSYLPIIPPTKPAGFPRPCKSIISALCCSVLAALLVAQIGGCDTAAVYQPVDSEAMLGRSVAVLRPTHVQPISQALHKRIVDGLEARLQQFPHLSRVLSRSDVERRLADDRKMMREYELYSDTLTVVGFSDLTGSVKLGKSLEVEMLLSTQLFYMPCPQCEKGSQMGLVANLVDAASGKLLWRGHFLAGVSEEDIEERAAVAESLADDFLVAFDQDLRPKWHRLRFANMSRPGAG